MYIKGSLHAIGGGTIKPPYEPEQVVFESSIPGTYSFKPEGAGIYYIISVSGGAGGVGGRGGNWSIGCSGSSGGLSELETKLKKKEHTIEIGSGGAPRTTNDGFGNPGGDTKITLGEETILAAGGAKASFVKCYQGGPSYSTLGEVGIGITKNGNPGSSSGQGDCNCNGGASVYQGYGTGGNGNRYGGYAGVGGYVKIIYKRMK